MKTTINNTVLVKTSTASATTYAVDKNGLLPMVFVPLAGKLPNKSMFISGTIADREGMLPNKMYLIQVTEKPSNQYGRQFQVNNLGEVSALDFATKAKEFFSSLGNPEVFSVENVVKTTITTAEVLEETKEINLLETEEADVF